jgi:asparagine synthase (glutamine-hydrolysing)
VIPTAICPVETIRIALTESVRRRMMADVPWGLLLSGGLDSSLVASIAVRIMREDAKAAAADPQATGEGAKHLAWGGKIHSFCIGLDGSPDIAAAQKVADYLGTIHHTFTFSLQEGLDAISDVIYSLETCVTTSFPRRRTNLSLPITSPLESCAV